MADSEFWEIPRIFFCLEKTIEKHKPTTMSDVPNSKKRPRSDDDADADARATKPLAGRATIYVVGDCHCGKTAFIQSLVTGEKVDESSLPVAGTGSSVPGR